MLGIGVSAPELFNTSCFPDFMFVCHWYVDRLMERYSPLAIAAIDRDTVKFRLAQFEKMIHCSCPLHLNSFVDCQQSNTLAYYFHAGNHTDDIEEFYRSVDIRTLREALATLPGKFPHNWLPVSLFWRYQSCRKS